MGVGMEGGGREGGCWGGMGGGLRGGWERTKVSFDFRRRLKDSSRLAALSYP